MAFRGETLKKVRERRRMSQVELSAAAGISESYVQGLERGYKKSPSMQVVQQLAVALDVPVLTFSGETEREALISDVLRDLSDRCRGLETSQIALNGVVPSRANEQGEVRERMAEYLVIPRGQIEEEGDCVFALEVVEALTDEGIDVGDYVVVRPGGEVVETGGVYVLVIKGARVLRRAWQVGRHVHMRPPLDREEVFPVGDVEVVGRVVLGGRWRKY